MGNILLVLLIFVIVFLIKNIILIRDLVISKNYKKIYKGILERDPDIINKTEEYLKTEKNEYLIYKTYILLMYLYLQNDIDPKEMIEKIDFGKVMLKNGKYNTQYANLNSDMIIWTLCSLYRLKNKGYLDTIKEKMDKLKDYFDNHIEYKVFYGAYALLNNDTENSKFLNDLVNGDYPKLNYDKQLIGVTKRIALAYIASLNKEKNIEYVDELKILAGSMLGKNLLIDLDIYEIYK